jgi:hypothetical protein
MGDGHSNGGSGDTPESLAAEREEMEEAVAGLRQMERDFETLTEQAKMFDPDLVAFCVKLKGSEMKRCIWKGFFTPEGFQWHKPAMAMEKALLDQLLQDLAAYCEALALWAEELEVRESKPKRQDIPALSFLASPGLGGEISAPSIGGAAADAEATGSILTGASLIPAAAAAIVVTGAAAVGYGAYKADVEPGLQAWAETSNDMRAQLDQENYEEDHGPEYENTPQKGLILNPGESRWQDGTIRTSNGQIAVDANGNSALSNEERQAIAASNGEGWSRPQGWRLPTANGQWTGTPGNSLWQSNIPEVNQVTGNRGIPFHQGYIDLTSFAVAQFDFNNLMGTAADFRLADQQLAANFGFNSTTAAAIWRSRARLTWHHVQNGITLQLVPSILNDIPHQGGASNLRNQ